MTTTRSQELRHALAFAAAARVYLRDGRPADALRLHLHAVRTLAFIMGAQSCRTDVVRCLGCTGGLRRVLDEQGSAIETAVRSLAPAPEADPVDLLEDIAASFRVLRLRDGIDLSEELIFERARNTLTGLVGNYLVLERGGR